jgi:hypothetical protein
MESLQSYYLKMPKRKMNERYRSCEQCIVLLHCNHSVVVLPSLRLNVGYLLAGGVSKARPRA